MVHSRILRAAKRVHSKLAFLNFGRTGLFRELLGRLPWHKALKGRGALESWLIFEDHLLHHSFCAVPILL